jgi:hypothetical protein
MNHAREAAACAAAPQQNPKDLLKRRIPRIVIKINDFRSCSPDMLRKVQSFQMDWSHMSKEREVQSSLTPISAD